MKKRIIGLFVLGVLLLSVCAPVVSFAMGDNRVVQLGEAVTEKLEGASRKIYYVTTQGKGTLNINFQAVTPGTWGWGIRVYQVWDENDQTKRVDKLVYEELLMKAVANQNLEVAVDRNVYTIAIFKSPSYTSGTPSGSYKITPSYSTKTLNVAGVKLDKARLTLKQGSKQKMTATLVPAGVANKAVTWRTSDKTVATVNSEGLVVAKAPGKAVISVTTRENKKTAKCTVTVKPKAKSVKLNKTVLELKKGKQVKLKAVVSPANAFDKSVTWKTSKAKVATVSKTGVVKAVSKGTTRITAVTKDGGKKASCKVIVK